MRVLTYNVHGCVGADGQLQVARVAEVVHACQPDIVALQEVDVHRRRSGTVHQAETLANLAGMGFIFHPALRQETEEYGEAILSRWPLALVQAEVLPTVPRPVVRERRGALWVRVHTPQGGVNVINTHLGLGRLERWRQAEALVGPAWVQAAERTGEPVILCGDFNSVPRRRVHTLLCRHLADAQATTNRGAHRATFPTRWPVLCLDYIFTHGALRAVHTEVPRTPLTRWASDHLPLLAELERAGSAPA